MFFGMSGTKTIINISWWRGEIVGNMIMYSRPMKNDIIDSPVDFQAVVITGR